MKFFLFFIFLVSGNVYGQGHLIDAKPIIDTTAIFSWPELGLAFADDVAFSPDGSFFSYRRKRLWDNNTAGGRILQSVKEGNVLDEIPFDAICFFSRDSKRFIYFSGEEITDLDIVSGVKRRIKGVVSMIVPEQKKGEYLIYHKKQDRLLVIEALLQPQKKLYYDSVSSYVFDRTGSKMAIIYNKGGDKNLKVFELSGNEKRSLCFSNNTEIEGVSFGHENKIVFLRKPIGLSGHERSIWLFDATTGKLELKADRKKANLQEDEYISRNPPFVSDDGGYVFFKVDKLRSTKGNENFAKVDIWNYKDDKLKNGCRLDWPPSYTFSVGINNNNIVRLENDTVRMVVSNSKVGDYVILSKVVGDRFWKIYHKAGFWVTSLKDGSHRFYINSGTTIRHYYYSPGGKYLVYCDSTRNRWDYYSCNIENGSIKNLTEDISDSQLMTLENNGKKMVGHGFLSSVAGWVPEEDAVLIYDSFDLLKLYLSGTKRSENITNSYGRRNNTRFSLTYGELDQIYKKKDTLLLTAFNWNTKFNGFFSKSLNKAGDPDSISMNPWVICGHGSRLLPPNDHMIDKGIIPLKAADTSLWLVKCNSLNSAPNYYITPDLKSFRKLTDVEPHRKYNWYTTELVHWKQYDGTQGSGILYKPENFDPKKKYPVIVYHYRELSQLLYYYSRPELTEAWINIPRFVSRGYLVLTPDVYVQENGSGPGAFNTVVSATEWLKTLPFVNGNRIGLNGHSQAGFQTNYIIAHTDVFAAALSGAGGADAILSAFLNPQCGIERFQLSEERYGSIWEHPELYIENSPFWLAHRVKTPLLLFHCKKDDAVPWLLSVQFFMSLWRLDKPAWLLQYDDSGHAVSTKRDLLDYSKRVDQFFDHFLKDSLPPEWMTKGVSTLDKGINTGFQLDRSY